MIFDSRVKQAIRDPKPEKACNWKDCPRGGNLKGLQARSVNGCAIAEECQAADWPKHKEVCKKPQNIDIGAYLEEHAWLFRWAACQALGRYGINLTMTHVLFIDLIRADRLVGPTPLSFLVNAVYIKPHGFAGQYWNMATEFYGKKDRQRCREIQKHGGLGVAQVGFRILGPNGTSMFWFERYEVEEPVCEEREVPGWTELVKKVANCEASPKAVRKFLSANDLVNCQATPINPVGIKITHPPRIHPESNKPRRKRKQKGRQ